jgi:sulfinoalanine decarboxylase
VATYAEEIVKNHKNLELLADRQSFAVCFRYIPENKTDLNKFNLALREAMRKNEKSIVNYGYIGKTLAIRLITANGELQKSDIDLFFDNLLKTATALENKSSSVLC